MNSSSHPSPTVSVILPTYNRATLLPPVIRSILDQGFADLELVIVDDGSTDNTAEVVGEIRERDPRLRYFALPVNRGTGHARDVALHHATGSYVALADSDDLWLPDRLEAQIKILEKYPEIDMLFGDFLDIDHVRGTRGMGLDGAQEGLELVVAHVIEDDLFLVERGVEIGILRSNFIAVPTIVLRRDVFDRVGGFNRTLPGTELEFFWRAAFLGAQYAYVDRPLIERHRHPDSVTAQGDRSWLRRLPALNIMYRACLKARRHDLYKHVRASELRTYRNLLWIYGKSGQRKQAVRTYARSLRRGISSRTTALFAVSMLGPRATRAAEEIRTIQQD